LLLQLLLVLLWTIELLLQLLLRQPVALELQGVVGLWLVLARPQVQPVLRTVFRTVELPVLVQAVLWLLGLPE